MSVEAKSPPPTDEPDPPRSGASTPGRLGRVLSLVRKLIDYGKQLAATVQQRAAAADFADFARPFGTADLAVILARITNGLRRAAALEDRLCRRAAGGKDLEVPSIRLPSEREARAAAEIAASDAAPAPQTTGPTEDPRLARLLTEQEIAAEVRRRPIGAVIVDICCDLGIAPGDLDRAFWDEISEAIILYGGNLLRWTTTLTARMFAFDFGGESGPADPGWPAASPRLPAAAATGPPR
jgi:hypothetical protein